MITTPAAKTAMVMKSSSCIRFLRLVNGLRKFRMLNEISVRTSCINKFFQLKIISNVTGNVADEIGGISAPTLQGLPKNLSDK